MINVNYYPFDSRNSLYRSHLGAVPAGETLRIRLLLHKDACVYSAFLRIVNDNHNNVCEIPMTPAEWLCDYQFFDCEITTAEGLYWYDFRYTSAHGEFFVVKSKNSLGVVSQIQGERFQLTVHDKDFTTPDWLKGGINISWDGVVTEARKAEPLRSIINPDSPEFYDGGNMEKKIQDFCRKTNQPVPETIGQVARCVYESLALKYRNALEGLEKMKGQRIDSLNIVGGPINNRFLNQLIADSIDRQVVTGPIEGAAMGNLLTQAMALGDIKDLDELRQVVRNSEAVETWEPDHSPAWEEAYQRYLNICKEV